MNIDLSCKSICELRFDRTQVSREEALVASRVQSLNASNNRIVHIFGLGSLFHRLVSLDLSHNCLGAAVGSDLCAWMGALPPSLRVLNLAHNGLRAFAGADAAEHNRAVVGVSGAMTAALDHLRRKCPLTLALFFSRERFPCLTELDLSYNALCITLDESDAVEGVLQKTFECPSASLAPWGNDHARWLECTTSSVTVLRLDGNAHLSALNGVLWGMEAVTHLCAANIGVTDLTAISAAATLCPKLHSFDLRGSPVVDALLQTSRHTLSNFAEMLLLPEIFHEERADENQKMRKKGNGEVKDERIARRDELQDIVRAVTQEHLEDIEAALLRQGKYGSDGLARVLYALLLQQMIPQLAKVDDDMDVNEARQTFMDAAREVLWKFIEKNNRLTNAGKNRQTSPCNLTTHATASCVRQKAQKKKCLDVSRGSADASSFTSLSSTHIAASNPKRDYDVPPTSGGGGGGVHVAPERLRGTHGMMTRAAAAVSAHLRPAVLVTNSAAAMGTISASPRARATASIDCTTTTTTTTTTSTATKDGNNGKMEGESFFATAAVSSSNTSKSSNRGGGFGGFRLKGDAQTLQEGRKTSSKHEPHFHSLDVTHAQSDSSSFSEGGTRGGRFQRALAALTPLLLHRLRTEVMPEKKSAGNNDSLSLENDHEASTVSTLTSTTDTSATREFLMQQAQVLEKALLGSQDRQRGMQEAVSQLKEQLRQDRLLITDQRKEAARLRQELDFLLEENKNTTRKLKKRQKEIAYGAAALRRREAMAQRRTALEHIEKEERLLRQAERHLREKMVQSGVLSRSCPTDFSELVETTLNGGMETKPLRKTRADLLREKAVQERMEAMRKKNPLAYNARKFRIGEYDTSIGDESSSFSTTDVAVAAATQQKSQQATTTKTARQDNSVADGCDSCDKRVRGKTPWRKERSNSVLSHVSTTTTLEKEKAVHQSLYDRGYNPYSNGSEEVGSDEYGTGTDDKYQSLQNLSLLQLFEEAAAMRKRQNILQQRLRDAAGGGSSGGNVEIVTDAGVGEHVKRSAVVNEGTCRDDNNDDVSATLGKHVPPTCLRVVGETGGLVSNIIPDDDSLDRLNDTNVNIQEGDRDDNNTLKDIVASALDSQLSGDFLLAAVPSSLVNGMEVAESLSNQGRQVQQLQGEEGVFLAPFSSAVEEPISMDARGIYNEILRQRQEQQGRLRQRHKRPQDAQGPQGVAGAKGVDFEREEEEELSSVSGVIKDSSSNEEEGVWNDAREFGEGTAARSHENGNEEGGIDNKTRRELFA